MAAAFYNLAAVLVRQDKLEEAEPMIRECLAIRHKKLPNDWRTFDALSLMGSALSRQVKYAEAEPLLLSGYDGMKQRESTIPAPTKVLSRAVNRLVQHYESSGRSADAAVWKERLELLKQRDIATAPRNGAATAVDLNLPICLEVIHPSRTLSQTPCAGHFLLVRASRHLALPQ